MEELPLQCNYLALGAARIREIKAIVSKLESCEHGGRAFQKLPRHMQRRAVSSNPRRLPRCLRDRHMREGGGNTKQSRRPRRKYRRRPSNLLQEYNRRQKEYVWLETHIWHAKRFHMRRQWGYALPDAPTCRGHRASLRAATTGCLLQDVSYLCCIELEGVRSSLHLGLSRVMMPESLAALTTPQILTGRQWTSVMFFRPDRQPFGAVAEVDLLFHPSQHNTEGDEARVKLWLWTHPSVHTTIVETLAEVFHLAKVSSSNDKYVTLSGETVNGEEVLEGKEGTGDIEGGEGKEETPIEDVATTVSKDEPGKKDELTHDTKEDHKKTKIKKKNVTAKKHQKRDCKEEKDVAKTEGKDEVTQDTKEDHKKTKVKKPKNVNAKKLQKRNVPFERTPKYVSVDGITTMTLLKDTLNRFRLLGPRSYTVLSSAIFPASVMREGEEGSVMREEEDKGSRKREEEEKSSVTRKEEEEDKGSIKREEEDKKTKACMEVKGHWWRHYFGDESLQSHQKQVDSWKQLASLPHPPAKVVLPLTVRDPRVTLTTKKVPMEEETSDVTQANTLQWPVHSPLYCSDLRDQVTLSKEPDAAINKRRSQLLVPGSQLPETPQEARLPLLLLSHPARPGGLGSGWEVVVPAGWGMSVFLPLVFRGGVASGQYQTENLHLGGIASLPPHLLPDTPAGDTHSTWLAAERHKEFFKRPPASRHNYIKLGVQFPFSQPWRKLMQAWQPGISDFFVLRNPRLITCLSHLIENAQTISKTVGEKDNVMDDSCVKDDTGTKPNKEITCDAVISNGNAPTGKNNRPGGKRKADSDLSSDVNKRTKHEDPEEAIHMDSTERDESEEADGTEELVSLSPACVVTVQLVLPHKGTLEPCAMICLPQEEDLCSGDGVLRAREQGDPPEEPVHEDANHDRRARMREEHCKITGRMRRVRRRARQRVAKEMDFETAAHSSQSVKAATSEALTKVIKNNEVILRKYSSYKEEMESAWLMSGSDSLQCCARPILGYITHGTFSHTHGRAAGMGWVGLKPLLRLLEQCGEGRGQKGSLLEVSRKAKGLPVLVRNPSTLQYRWALLSVV